MKAGINRLVDTIEAMKESVAGADEEEEEIDLMAVRAERLKLKAELDELEGQMEEYLKELGY